ncbi:DUF6350 family protein [Nocardioides mesophilus]|uniref:Uncharacterized protein n=1 Tax=Nocardioides mesophilus TaxID=433659 RepID=A0A7G9RDR1_9ACTN|nr:DUF6350 family protein [Nocardioides mesophilus]QNN53736.1 hypothetical protein H9L09_04795 [Nocardioides mesophilus]
MTDLLTRPRTASTPGGEPVRRPLWLSAGLAGATAAGAVLVGCMALALVGWFASDAGAHGDTRDALRVGAVAWLLGHGSGLALGAATISLVPLGLTFFCCYVTYRLGRWAALTSESGEPDRSGLATIGLSTVVLAGVYGVVALLTSVLAATPAAQPSLGRSFLGGTLVGLVAGGLGLLSGWPHRPALLDRVPAPLRAVAGGALACALLLLAAGSVLVVTRLLLDLGSAANVLSRLHTDTAGGGLYTVVVAGVAPNAALLGAAYLLGPGFAVGTGTIVSPASVVLGPVPAFPLLAALPQPGPGPAWATGLIAVPVLLAALAAALTGRRHPLAGYDRTAVRGLAIGLLGGLLSTLLVVGAGGSVGPGRMSLVGAPGLEVLTSAVLSMTLGALLGALVTTWRQRRGAVPADEPDDRSADAGDVEDTVRL